MQIADAVAKEKAIDKEIQIIKERSEKDNVLMADGYLKTKKKLLLVMNDNRPNELRDAVKIIVNDDINNWINFNLEFAKTKNLKKSKLAYKKNKAREKSVEEKSAEEILN